ncbi:hypothetical protein [uncultured Hyphomicrobium sp.]|jgi:hypothetical protein|uniref:hypothetical protein n=1 Tax=uncultured Hyphomicrobium sp. TaxID=194373 RepID=UPI0025EFA5FE|nr:hypothetical protein [uncultured Hyphomicrobium sp.]
MSTPLVTYRHVDMLVSYAGAFGMIRLPEATSTGQLLLDAHVCALESRPGRAEALLGMSGPDYVGRYRYQPSSRGIDLPWIGVVRATLDFDAACEAAADYHVSAAAALARRIRFLAAMAVPGYADAQLEAPS